MGKVSDLSKTLLKGLRKSVSDSVEANRRKVKENQTFNQILSKKLETERRQAFAKETIRQERRRIKEQVEAKFSKAKKKPNQENLIADIARGMPR